MGITAGIQNAQSYDLMVEWSLMSVVSTFEEPLLLLAFFCLVMATWVIAHKDNNGMKNKQINKPTHVSENSGVANF